MPFINASKLPIMLYKIINSYSVPIYKRINKILTKKEINSNSVTELNYG